MRFEIAATVPELERVKIACRQVAKTAKVSTSGLLVKVEMHRRGHRWGGCWGDAMWVSRKGTWVAVKGYIKIRFVDWEQLAHSFAHELSHLKDSRRIRVPWEQERRARAFADRVVSKMVQGR